MKSKKADFNFVLLFAIIAGSAILLLAIYGAVKTGVSEQTQQSAELSKTIDIITNPLQAGFSKGKSNPPIVFPKETRISNNCYFQDDFGYNEISVQSKPVTGDWLTNPISTKITNKYIFSEYEEGKKFYVLSKPFEMPFKISDLLFMTSQQYCLVSYDEEANDIIKEMLFLGPSNIGVKTTENNTCLDDSIQVCFGYASRCNITIIGQCSNCKSEYEYGIVKKENQEIFYVGNLLYGAVFSDKENYECNVQRLLFRTSKISQLLSEKADLMNARGCNTNFKQYVDIITDLTSKADISQLKDIYSTAQTIKELKDFSGEECELWQ